MGFFSFFKNMRQRFVPQPIDQWFLVQCDEIGVSLDVTPPGERNWKDRFTWDSVERICFKDEGLYASDAYYVFTTARPESYVVPAEAQGGNEFVEQMLEHNLFDEKHFVKAMSATDGGLYCWPEIEDRENE